MRAFYVAAPAITGYGSNRDIAHQMVTLSITAAEDPVLLDARGELIHVPRAWFQSLATWERG